MRESPSYGKYVFRFPALSRTVPDGGRIVAVEGDFGIDEGTRRGGRAGFPEVPEHPRDLVNLYWRVEWGLPTGGRRTLLCEVTTRINGTDAEKRSGTISHRSPGQCTVDPSIRAIIHPNLQLFIYARRIDDADPPEPIAAGIANPVIVVRH
jgi:hypothetical protein